MMENNSKSSNKVSLFWHRRDLRINDNHGLFKALTSGNKIIPIFIFDTTILSKLKTEDQRVIFIHQQIEKLKSEYQSFGVILFCGKSKRPIFLNLPDVISDFLAFSILYIGTLESWFA